jgi:hypothetical protein
MIFMLRVMIKPIILSDITLNVNIMSVIVLNVIIFSVIMLNGIAPIKLLTHNPKFKGINATLVQGERK